MACFKMKLRHLCFTVMLSSVAISCCRGQGGVAAGGAGGAAGGPVAPETQDAIQIVAQAALCFDNRQVINGCLHALGINVKSNSSGSGNGTRNGATSTAAPPALAPAPGPSAAGMNNGSAASLCQGPCFDLIMLTMTCVNDTLSNSIGGYNPGLMQGVEAIFQMACGNVSHGGGGAGSSGGTAGASGSHVAVSSLGEPTTSAAGPTASLKSGGVLSMLMTWNCVWLLLLSY